MYDRILAHVAASPWAIEPAKGQVIAEFLSRKAAGETIPRAEVEVAMAAARDRRPKGRSRSGSVALVPLYGVMTQRSDLFTEVSGLASTEAVGRQIDEAAADPAVEVVVIDIDSPGGQVYGTAELAAKVAAAASRKKVIAVANSLAASGAYYVAAQASEVIVTPSGQVGSIGVFRMHVDQSEALKQAGRVVTLVSAGERKTAAYPGLPLGPLGLAEIQNEIDDYYDQFVRAVARGRNATLTKVREGFGRGGMVRAEGAVREGMADRVATLGDVLARYGLSLTDTGPAALARMELSSRTSAGTGRDARPGKDWEVEVRRRRMLLT